MDTLYDNFMVALECGKHSSNLLGKYSLTLSADDKLKKTMSIPDGFTEIIIEFSLEYDNYICEFDDRHVYEIYIVSNFGIFNCDDFYGATITIKKNGNDVILTDANDYILTIFCDEFVDCEIKQINKISGTNTENKISKFVENFDRLIGIKRKSVEILDNNVEYKIARIENLD